MAKIYKTVKVEYEKQIVDTIYCDICSEKFDPKEESKEFDTFGQKTKVVVGMDKIIDNGDYGAIYRAYYDICPDCYENKVLPLLKGLNIKPPETTDLEW